MGETTTIVRDAADVPGAALNDIAATVGALTNETAHHAQSLAAHAEKITAIEEKHEWLTTRLDNLERTTAEVPAEAIAALRSELESVKQELTAQVAALSEAVVPQTEDPQTDPPPQAPNEAEPPKQSGPLGGLRKALHRLL